MTHSGRYSVCCWRRYIVMAFAVQALYSTTMVLFIRNPALDRWLGVPLERAPVVPGAVEYAFRHYDVGVGWRQRNPKLSGLSHNGKPIRPLVQGTGATPVVLRTLWGRRSLVRSSFGLLPWPWSQCIPLNPQNALHASVVTDVKFGERLCQFWSVPVFGRLRVFASITEWTLALSPHLTQSQGGKDK